MLKNCQIIIILTAKFNDKILLNELKFYIAAKSC